MSENLKHDLQIQHFGNWRKWKEQKIKRLSQ